MPMRDAHNARLLRNVTADSLPLWRQPSARWHRHRRTHTPGAHALSAPHDLQSTHARMPPVDTLRAALSSARTLLVLQQQPPNASPPPAAAAVRPHTCTDECPRTHARASPCEHTRQSNTNTHTCMHAHSLAPPPLHVSTKHAAHVTTSPHQPRTPPANAPASMRAAQRSIKTAVPATTHKAHSRNKKARRRAVQLR